MLTTTLFVIYAFDLGVWWALGNRTAFFVALGLIVVDFCIEMYRQFLERVDLRWYDILFPLAILVQGVVGLVLLACTRMP